MTFLFGKHVVNSSELFFQSALSVGLVNLRPIVPGHVLVVCRRPIERLGELSNEEVCDLFCVAQRIGNVIEKAYEASSLSFIVQDGKDSGQTVPHVHVHVIPRRKGDFEPNDTIYEVLEGKRLESQDRVECPERKARGPEEMAKEAQWLSSFLQ